MRLDSHRPHVITQGEVEWRDGTLYSSNFGDIYFSKAGAVEESESVYLEGNNLPARFRASKRTVIGELGFGTGLNFILTLKLWKKNSLPGGRLFYFAYEKHPIGIKQISESLSHLLGKGDELHELIKLYPQPIEGLHILDFPTSRVRLLLSLGDANEKLAQTSAQIDAWYLDGFSPSKNAELWSDKVLSEVTRLSQAGTTLSTYSVASIVRERLSARGWEIQKVQGVGDKRETLRGKLISGGQITIQSTPKKIAILGAGIAGCAVANAISQRGVSCELFDLNSEIAGGASRNLAAIVQPYPSSERDLRHRFYVAAFQHLTRYLDHHSVNWEQSGVLLAPFRERQLKILEQIAEFKFPVEFVRVVSGTEASDISKVRLSDRHLYFPTSGNISLPQLCQQLVHCNVNVRLSTKCRGEYDFVIVATAQNKTYLPDSISTKIIPVKGEIGFVSSDDVSKELRLPICKAGYVLPAKTGSHLIGATYHRAVDDCLPTDIGRAELQQIFRSYFPNSKSSVHELVASVRATTHDRMPFIGEISTEKLNHSGIHANRAFVSIGHGSRGAVSALLSAELIAAWIFSEPLPVENEIEAAISNNRI